MAGRGSGQPGRVDRGVVTVAWRRAGSPAWLGEREGSEAELGSWARAVGDLGGLTVEWWSGHGGGEEAWLRPLTGLERWRRAWRVGRETWGLRA